MIIVVDTKSVSVSLKPVTISKKCKKIMCSCEQQSKQFRCRVYVAPNDALVSVQLFYRDFLRLSRLLAALRSVVALYKFNSNDRLILALFTIYTTSCFCTISIVSFHILDLRVVLWCDT